jgi:outer membrane protein assembly factor BamE (lipoprotein component of BamABCDE complex)
MNRATTTILTFVAALFANCGSVRASEPVPAKHLIAPGVGVGDFALGMSKDDVLKKAGKPKIIYSGRKTYTLEDLPSRYFMYFGDIQFEISYDEVREIVVMSSSYTFDNGLGVGDSEDRIKQVFGEGFYLNGGNLIYAKKGLRFGIDRNSRTIERISIFRARPNQTIVPGASVGNIKLGMSKDDLLIRLGKPEKIHWASNNYTLDNLPIRYRMNFGDISLEVNYNEVQNITAHTPFYKFANGMGVGDSEDRIRQAFGEDFYLNGDDLIYGKKGLRFGIDPDSRTVDGIGIIRARTNQTIVPGVSVGNIELGMSKDDVVKKLGKPEKIHWASNNYTPDNLPRQCCMLFSDIEFRIDNDVVTEIITLSPFYTFDNGLGVGETEETIKQTFGEDFYLSGGDLNYADKGVRFRIDEDSRTVKGISIFRAWRR